MILIAHVAAVIAVRHLAGAFQEAPTQNNSRSLPGFLSLANADVSKTLKDSHDDLCIDNRINLGDV